MELATENVGFLARLWPKKQSEIVPALTFSQAGQKLPVPVGNNAKQTETDAKSTGPKLLKGPGLGSLLIILIDRTLCVSEIADDLRVSRVAASRLVAEAERKGFVEKQKRGRYVYVTAVPKEKRPSK